MQQNNIYKTLLNRGKTKNKDSKKTALVVQGGGMRGVYSMAALMAIEELGLTNAFDIVYGSSAGAINGAYFVANQAKLAVSVYLEDISNKHFINLLRFNKIADIDFLIDEILSKKKILNLNEVLNSKTLLKIVLFDYYNAKSEIFTNKMNDFNFMEALRATAALPILYNKKVKVKENYYIDGGIEDGVPLFRAIEDGCTDIVVVITRPINFRRIPLTFLMRNIENFLMRGYPVKTREKILDSVELFNNTMDCLENQSYRDINIYVISPSNMDLMVSRTTNDKSKLLKCALMGRNDTFNLFNVCNNDDNPFDL